MIMNFSLEIGLKTDLGTLPDIKDVYITLLRGDQFKDVAYKARELIKLGKKAKLAQINYHVTRNINKI